METEKRLIDANALIAEYDRVHIGPPGGARKLMEEAPTVDAVEVVRCKDCRWRKERGLCYMISGTGVGTGTGDDFFCSYGERKYNAQGKE